MSIAQYLSKFALGVNSQGILSAAKGGTGNTSGAGTGTGSTPTITGISYPDNDTAANPAGGQTITLTGTNFATGVKVVVNGIEPSTVTRVNPTQITFTSPALAVGSYIVYVVNTDGTTALLVPGLQVSAMPTWTTAAGTLGTADALSSVSYTVGATGDGSITYSVYNSSLPSGLTLNSSTGTISGTTPSPLTTTTYNFTIRATDAQFQDTDRAFSVTVLPPVPAGQIAYTTPGTYSFVVPDRVNTICAVLVGPGSTGGTGYGGAGGSLRYINDLPVTPGETLEVYVGAGGGYGSTGPTTLKRGSNTLLLAASNNTGGNWTAPEYPTASTSVGAGPYGGTVGGGNGGSGGTAGSYGSPGGGGAGGYSGNGGNGGYTGAAGSGGAGGGGGGAGGQSPWNGGGGGGVGLYGQGSNGGGGGSYVGGGGGSGGADGDSYKYNVLSRGGLYGGGGGGNGGGSGYTVGYSPGGNGGARIIWGAGRAFPSTLTTDQ